METVMTILVGAVLALLLGATVLELAGARKRRREALYLVSRVGARHGFTVRERPLSLEVPGAAGTAKVHYHLLAPGDERDSITLKARRAEPTRLGNVVMDSDPARIYAPNMRRVTLGSDRFDPHFRIFTQSERADLMANLIAGEGELLSVARDLACRTTSGHFELDDLSGILKIQFDDESIRFPSDIEEITLDVVRLYRLYRVLAGEA